MDWGLVSYSKATRRLSFRTRCLWPLPSYVFAAIINLALRFSWASHRLPFLARLHPSHVVSYEEGKYVLNQHVRYLCCRSWLWSYWKCFEDPCGTSSELSGRSSCSRTDKQQTHASSLFTAFLMMTQQNRWIYNVRVANKPFHQS